MKIVVISIGGSALNPGKVNKTFLRSLKSTVLKLSKKHKLVLVTGGGGIARDYITALNDKPVYVRDVMGIHCTRLNATLLASYLGKCNQEIPETLEHIHDLLQDFRIVVCGGLRPGTTSDGTTASVADYLDADTMINMTNVKGLYTKDPSKFKNAKFVKNICHKHFKTFMDKVKEKPGQHFILDSTAAKIARDGKRKVIVLKGIKNLENAVLGRKFEGTTIS
tara:strand:+ start:1799 stop:2464 length:666 start_codon:yes stop_codon:yes gene_type:complete